MHESEYISLFKFCDLSALTSFQINQMIDFTFYDSSQISILQKIIPTLLLANKTQDTNLHLNNTNSSRASKNHITTKSEPKIVTTNSKKQDIPSEKSPSISNNSPTFDEITYPAQGIKGSRNGKPPLIPPEHSHFVDVEYEPGFELNGIVVMFQNFFQKSRWKDEIIVKCSEKTKAYLKYTIFDYNSDKYWDNFDGESCKHDTAWIVVGFPRYSLRLKYYTISPKQLKKNFRPPKSWKIYGSHNSTQFDESDLIEYVKEAPTMKVLDKINTFEVKNKAKPYSYFKFVLMENYSTKKIDAGDFNISGLELFGILSHL